MNHGNVINPSQGGLIPKRAITTIAGNYGHVSNVPEEIVRQHRINTMQRRLESLQPEKKSSAILERILKIFLWLTIGWGIGYFHHYLAG